MARNPKGVREKALQFLREVPRLSSQNIKGLPNAPNFTKKKRGHGQHGGKQHGWGDSARQKLYYAPIGFEGGQTPIQRKTTYERSYNYGVHAQRQFPEISLEKLQLMIDTGRLDPGRPIDLAALCSTRVVTCVPDKNQFGFNLTGEGMDRFVSKVNIEVQWANEQAIAAIERVGGRITCGYFDLHSAVALTDPVKFFMTGAPIPRRLTPPQALMRFYVNPSNRGYLADPMKVKEDKLVLAQKYGYELTNKEGEEEEPFMTETKDPRQIFYGLEPGWVVSLAEKRIYKPTSEQLQRQYSV